jgi:hypothetical protein
MNFYLKHHTDDTLEIIIMSSGTPKGAIIGPNGSYFTLLSHYMDFTDRVDRLPIRTDGQDQIMECIDAVTRLVGRKLNVYICASPVFDDSWSITLGTSTDMIVISFLYTGDITALTALLKENAYNVNA